jgi:hypothetical protein
MDVKAPSRYVQRFAKGLGCFGLLVVKITWLRCPYEVTVRGVTSVTSATASSSASRPTGVSFWSLDSSNGC